MNIRATKKQILQYLAIDWIKAEWKDLLKPMYSALAATLLTKIRLRLYYYTISADISQQAIVWDKYFNDASENQDFKTVVSEVSKGQITI